MSEKTKGIIERYIIPALLAVALIAVTLWATRQKANAESYKNTAASMYSRAYGQLAEDLYEMETALSKLTVVNSPAQYIMLLDEVWRLSGSAVSSMAYIPVSHVDTTELNQFVVRLGDYAHALTKKAAKGGMITDEDVSTINELRNSCASLAKEFGERYQSGDIPLEAIGSEGYFTQSDSYKDSDSIEGFPTLIYDGPFAQSSEKLEPRGLSGNNITQEQAESIAEALTGVDMTFSGKNEGKIPAFEFSFSDDNGWKEASITEQGGRILYFMGNSSSGTEGRPNEEEAERFGDTATAFLNRMGYPSMIPTYAQYYGGCAVINCAAAQNGVILYSDLIKVWVDRETGSVIGIDARNYLFSHRTRELPTPQISLEEAESLLSPNLDVESRELALIPITPETEKLCYEFKCTLGEEAYIVYINVENGDEEQVFKIIDSEDGVLVI